jgi:hypothetical protein
MAGGATWAGFYSYFAFGQWFFFAQSGKKKKTIGGNAKSLFQETWNSNVP